MHDDWQLLRAYVETGSASAFAEIVSRDAGKADGWKFHLGYMTDKQENLKKIADAYGLKATPDKR